MTKLKTNKLQLAYPTDGHPWASLLLTIDTTKLLRHITDAVEGEMAEPKAPAYVAGSMFLHDCFRYLTRTAAEELHLVTGVDADGVFVLDRLVAVDRCGSAQPQGLGEPQAMGKRRVWDGGRGVLARRARPILWPQRVLFVRSRRQSQKG